MPYVTGAVIAAAALGYSVYSGERANAMQRRALRDQKQANATAELSAARGQSAAEKAAARAKKKIDVAMLANASIAGLDAPTMLTGAAGVGVGKLKLGSADNGLAGDV